MIPTDVQHRRFVLQRVLFNDGVFSIAFGTWDGSPAIGVRWNGEGEDDLGYPTSRGRPVWFIWTSALESALLGGLVAAQGSKGLKGLDVDALAAVIKMRGI